MQKSNKDKIIKRRTTRSRTILIDYKPADSNKTVIEKNDVNSDDQQIIDGIIEIENPTIGIRSRVDKSKSSLSNLSSLPVILNNDEQKPSDIMINDSKEKKENDIKEEITKKDRKPKLDLSNNNETEKRDDYKFPNIKDRIKYFEAIKQVKITTEVHKETEERIIEKPVVEKKDKSNNIKKSTDISTSKYKQETNKKLIHESKSKESFKTYNETQPTHINIDHCADKDNQDIKFKSVRNIIKIFENLPLQNCLIEKKIENSALKNFHKDIKKEISSMIVNEKPYETEFIDNKPDKILRYKVNKQQKSSQIKGSKKYIKKYAIPNDCNVGEAIKFESNKVRLINDDSHLQESFIINKTDKAITFNIGTQSIARSYDFASILDRWKKVTKN